ncbi:hypothetical protein Acsp03_70480 [Actinomadura sp. NBRC 104412]|uniref:hypothetical protein n=1 Tax=Actinomadura sp. NBRC 104412 TaxID=3032203 RepID=UPI0024A3E394|nr:hypothetical protein [Actinomadura sp. NBRC 104412]GLZ09582.1 hypothetical protein Acsp03_70480 [Actinomadura sp. NBRC 104412]
MPATQDGGALRGGAPRAVWFSSESDPRVVSARSVAADLLRRRTPAHLVWNPCSGQIVQLVPVNRAGALIDGPAGHEGRVCVQVLVVGHARDPFTGTVLNGLNMIMQWLDAWRVERRWPAGPPLPSPQSYHAQRARRDWARGGHFGASQVPGVNRPDPGGIDIRRVTGPDTPVTAVPRHHPTFTQPSHRPFTPDPIPLRPAPVPVVGSDEEPAASASTRLAVPLPRTAEASSSPSSRPGKLTAPLATTAPTGGAQLNGLASCPADADHPADDLRSVEPPRPVPEPASTRT